MAACTLGSPRVEAKTTGDLVAATKLQLPENTDVNPFELVAADVNGDKRVDLVGSGTVMDPNTGVTTKKVVSFINNGNGTFKEITALADAHGQRVMVLADLNGDGILDLVCGYGYADPNLYKVFDIDVEVSFGHGDGTFAAAEKYTVNGNRFVIKAADINGDGKMDLVVAADGLYLPLINKGDGTFKNGYSYQATTGNGFTLADVNGDGRADLLIPENFHLTIAFGMTNGAFGNTRGVSIRPYAGPPAVGDLNGDHVADIVVPTMEGVDILIGDGGGDFHPGTPVNPGASVAVNLTDLNNDGKLDLLISQTSTNLYTQQDMSRVSVYPGNGDGTFSAPRVYVGGGGNNFLGVFDVTGTHAPDVVMANLTVLPGDGYGSLKAAIITRVADASGVATGDFNGDGITDVVAANSPECSCPSTLTFLPGTGQTWLGTPKVTTIGTIGAFVGATTSIAVGDINKDGKLDLALVFPESDSVIILLGNADGTFQAPRITSVGTNYTNEVFLADVNNDGKLDLVLDSGVMLGNGNGTFGSLIAFPPYPTHGISAVGVADVNGDGKPDIVASLDLFTGPSTIDDYEMVILLGDGKGNFTQSKEWPVNGSVTQIIPAKMHNGTLPDLVLRFSYGSSGVSILLNDGHGNFPTTPDVQYYQGWRYIAVGDMNGDGINDVVGMSTDLVVVMLGKGDGTLLEPANLPYPLSYQALTGPLALGDINHDGALDVLTASPLGISRYINAAIPAP